MWHHHTTSTARPPREPLNKYHVLSVTHGLCGEARSAANVGHLGKECNEVHKARVLRPAGGYGAHADRVAPLGKVTYITGEARLVSARAKTSELLILVQRLPSHRQRYRRCTVNGRLSLAVGIPAW